MNMKTILTIIILSLLLSGCSTVIKPKLIPQDCVEGLIFSNLCYNGTTNGRCITKEALADIVMVNCVKAIKKLDFKDENLSKQMIENCIKNYNKYLEE